MSLKPLPSRLGLGTSRIGSFNNPASLSDSERLVREALDLGVAVLDTASIYGQGDSERTIGRAIAGRREEAFVVTKGPRTFSARYRALQPLKPIARPLLTWLGKGKAVAAARRDDALAVDWSGASLSASLEGSLKRLGTDRVDAFLLHGPPTAVAGDPLVGEALLSLRQRGLARRVGISCEDRGSLEAALTQQVLDIVQLPWSVIATLGPLQTLLRERAIIVLAREVIVEQPGVSPGEALRNALSHPAVDCTLVGTTNREHLRSAAALMTQAGS